MNNQQQFEVLKVHAGSSVRQADVLAVEEPLEICLKQIDLGGSSSTRLLVTTMRTPGDDLNLVKGWLLSSGLLSTPDAIQSIYHTGSERLKGDTTNTVLVTLKPAAPIDIQSYQRIDYVNSSCGVCGQQSIEQLLDKLPQQSDRPHFCIAAQQLYLLPERLGQLQSLFQQTGGNHGVALFDQSGKVSDVHEDVGRHNAMDKLIGAHFDKMVSGNFGVLLSGRVSFELVQKAAMANIRLLVAIGAPTSLAIELAKECDIGVVGFVKKQSFNIYHASHMINLD